MARPEKHSSRLVVFLTLGMSALLIFACSNDAEKGQTSGLFQSAVQSVVDSASSGEAGRPIDAEVQFAAYSVDPLTLQRTEATQREWRLACDDIGFLSEAHSGSFVPMKRSSKDCRVVLDKFVWRGTTYFPAQGVGIVSGKQYEVAVYHDEAATKQLLVAVIEALPTLNADQVYSAEYRIAEFGLRFVTGLEAEIVRRDTTASLNDTPAQFAIDRATLTIMPAATPGTPGEAIINLSMRCLALSSDITRCGSTFYSEVSTLAFVAAKSDGASLVTSGDAAARQVHSVGPLAFTAPLQLGFDPEHLSKAREQLGLTGPVAIVTKLFHSSGASSEWWVWLRKSGSTVTTTLLPVSVALGAPTDSFSLAAKSLPGLGEGQWGQLGVHMRVASDLAECRGTYNIAADAKAINLEYAQIRPSNYAADTLGLTLGETVRSPGLMSVKFSFKNMARTRLMQPLFSVSKVQRLAESVSAAMLSASWTLDECGASGQGDSGFALLEGGGGGETDIPMTCSGDRICINGVPEDVPFADNTDNESYGVNVKRLILTVNQESAVKFNRWQFKIGPNESTDCGNSVDYVEVDGASESLLLDLSASGLNLISQLPADNKKITLCARGRATTDGRLQAEATRYVWTFDDSAEKLVEVRLLAVSALHRPMNSDAGSCVINYANDSDRIADLTSVPHQLEHLGKDQEFFLVAYAKAANNVPLGAGAIDIVFEAHKTSTREVRDSDVQPAQCADAKSSYKNFSPQTLTVSRAVYQWCRTQFTSSPRDCQYMTMSEAGSFQNIGLDTFVRRSTRSNRNDPQDTNAQGKWIRVGWVGLKSTTDEGLNFVTKPGKGATPSFAAFMEPNDLVLGSYAANQVQWNHFSVQGPPPPPPLVVEAGLDKLNQKTSTVEQITYVSGGRRPYGNLRWDAIFRPPGVNADQVGFSIRERAEVLHEGEIKERVITNITVPENAFGDYTLRLSATDASDPANTASDEFVFQMVQELTVNAGPDKVNNVREFQQQGVVSGGMLPYTSPVWTWLRPEGASESDVSIANSQSLTPTFTIAESKYGDYEFELRVVDAAGNEESDRFTYRYVNLVVDAGLNGLGTSATFAAVGASIAGGSVPYDLTWSFRPSGTQSAGDVSINDPKVLLPSFQIAGDKVGKFVLRLTVVDHDGVSAVDEFQYERKSLTVVAGPDVLQVSPVYSRQVGQVEIRLDGVLQSDPSIFHMQWRQVSGAEAAITGGAGATPTFTANRIGAHVFALDVGVLSMPGIQASGQFTFTVREQELSFSAGADRWANASFVKSDATHNAALGTGPFQYQWSYTAAGDAPAGMGAITFSDSILQPSISVQPVSAQGKYDVSLKVTDSLGNSASADSFRLIWDTEPPAVQLAGRCSATRSFTLAAAVSDNFQADGSIDLATATWSTTASPAQMTLTVNPSNRTQVLVNILQDGQYPVRFSIKDRAGNQSSMTNGQGQQVPHEVLVAYVDPALVVSAGPDRTAGETLTLADATVTSSPLAPICGVQSHAWTVAGGAHAQKVNIQTAALLNPQVELPDPTTVDDPANPGQKYGAGAFDGTYTLTLTAIDGAGRSISDSMNFTWSTGGGDDDTPPPGTVPQFPCHVGTKLLPVVEIRTEVELRSQLGACCEQGGKYYRLMNDITLTSSWLPLPLVDSVFDGAELNEDGVPTGVRFKIKGLRIGNSTCSDCYDYAALFSKVEASIVRNLVIEDYKINTSYPGGKDLQAVAVLTAEANHAFIQNVHLDGTPNDVVRGDGLVGGLIARISDVPPILYQCDANYGSRVSGITVNRLKAESYAESPARGFIAGESVPLSSIENGQCTDPNKVCVQNVSATDAIGTGPGGTGQAVSLPAVFGQN